MTTYLIDGYNLMHATGHLVGKVSSRGLERARLRFQDYLVAAFGQESSSVTIVYDASRIPRGVPAEQTCQGLNILLAGAPQEADDLIETLIARQATPKSLMVVSSDRRLQAAARRKGAVPMTCPEFMDYLEKRCQKPSPPPTAEPEKKIQMTEQEKEAWMQEFAGLNDDPRLKEALKRFDFEDQ